MFHRSPPTLGGWVVHCTMEEVPMEELPDELKEDSIKLFRSFEELLDQYNNYIQNAIKMSGLPD